MTYYGVAKAGIYLCVEEENGVIRSKISKRTRQDSGWIAEEDQDKKQKVVSLVKTIRH